MNKNIRFIIEKKLNKIKFNNVIDDIYNHIKYGYDIGSDITPYRYCRRSQINYEGDFTLIFRYILYNPLDANAYLNGEKYNSKYSSVIYK